MHLNLKNLSAFQQVIIMAKQYILQKDYVLN